MAFISFVGKAVLYKVGEIFGRIHVVFGDHDNKFVAAPAPDECAAVAAGIAQGGGHHAQGIVAFEMAKAVVDFFKRINVNNEKQIGFLGRGI